jgi:hypothetical protein
MKLKEVEQVQEGPKSNHNKHLDAIQQHFDALQAIAQEQSKSPSAAKGDNAICEEIAFKLYAISSDMRFLANDLRGTAARKWEQRLSKRK